MIDFARKRIYPGEETLKHLVSLKRDRARLGMTQANLAEKLGIPLKTYRCYEYGTSYPMLSRYLMLAEILGWDIREDPNYLFYKGYHRKYNRLQTRKRMYAYTNVELSRELNVSEEAVRHVIKKKKMAVYRITR